MRRGIYFILALGLWMAVTWSADVQNIVAGIVCAGLCAVFLGHTYFENAGRIFDPRRIGWFLYFIPVFLLHMVKANIDVAYRVLHLNIPIRPGIVTVRTTLRSDLALTFLANSITLTPGTLTVDIIGNELYIHWINVLSDDPEEQTQIIVTRFERILTKVFE